MNVEASHTRDGRKASAGTAGVLDPFAFYCNGALLVLTKIAWQSAGLCNGATGKIMDIIYADGTLPPNSLRATLIDHDDTTRSNDYNHLGSRCAPPVYGDSVVQVRNESINERERT